MIRQDGFFARWAAVAAFLAMALMTAGPVLAAEKVLVFAAASLMYALDEVKAAWQADTGESQVREDSGLMQEDQYGTDTTTDTTTEEGAYQPEQRPEDTTNQ